MRVLEYQQCCHVLCSCAFLFYDLDDVCRVREVEFDVVSKHEVQHRSDRWVSLRVTWVACDVLQRALYCHSLH